MRGQWVALVRWKTGLFQGKPGDPWLDWSQNLQFKQFHLIGDPTRCLPLPEAQGCPNLGAHALGTHLQRLGADWQAAVTGSHVTQSQ